MPRHAADLSHDQQAQFLKQIQAATVRVLQRMLSLSYVCIRRSQQEGTPP